MAADEIDISACAAEPIRVPGGIQPHGALLVIDPATGDLLQASANAARVLGVDLGRPVLDQLDPALGRWVLGEAPVTLRTIALGGGEAQVVGHRSQQGTILEFEPTEGARSGALDDIYPAVQRFADDIVAVDDLPELGRVTAAAMHEMTGFNRVLIYDFDPDWNGTVFGESNDGVLPSYFDLRFPASDIPAQARELYRLNTLRIIPDADYEPVPIEPAASPRDGKPLDLSFAVLRSVSPVHLQYMRNMGTYASMSVSIVVEDKLWGLISCHNAAARRVAPQVRAACNIFAKLFALKVSSLLRGAHAAERMRLKGWETELVARLSQSETIEAGLARNPDPWLALTGADGAAIVTDKGTWAVGRTPPEEALGDLAEWLRRTGRTEVFATDSLGANWPPAADFAADASGLLAVSISQLHPSYILWFRPEVERTVKWSGDPRKAVEPGSGRLSPRQSFALWKEEVRGRSIPWTAAQVESASDFRSVAINTVLRRAEERAELTDELERINSELESFSYSVSHDLRAPFRHIVGYAELLRDREKALDEKSTHYLANIIGAALAAGELVDDLLAFSQLGRANVERSRVDMGKLVAEVRHSMESDLADRRIEWSVGTLDPAWGDPTLLRQALANLIENAVKYTRPRDLARIEIASRRKDGMVTYSISDNGVGFDMAYVDKLFGVFQRLHKLEDFEGTGIGLALTKRIIDRHGGAVTARGAPDEGATFTFTLPAAPAERANA